jgi:hypothetical protein
MVVGHKKLHDVSASRACALWTTAAALLAVRSLSLPVLLLFPNRVIAGYPAVIGQSAARRALWFAAPVTLYLYDHRLVR